MFDDKKYGVCVTIPREMPGEDAWKYAKHRLNRQILEQVYEPTLGDELHHVFCSRYYKDEHAFDETRYYMEVEHSLVEKQHITMRVMEDITFGTIPTTARLICKWCGCVETLSSKGACSACGGPPGR